MEGVKVYAPDEDHVWLPGVVCHAANGGKKLAVRFDRVIGPEDPAMLEQIASEMALHNVAGKERQIDLDDPHVRKFLQARNPTPVNAVSVREEMTPKAQTSALSLPLQNARDGSSTSNGFEDMITIDHLHEASILYNLRRRFFRKLPYTYTGKICIAVNPYQWLNLYDKKIMEQFSDGKRDEKPPHVYAVSMEAFFNMRERKEDQSILVSGESGAGKTETTKIVMSHLASLASNSNSKVIQQIIQANPLLESFGNAKTVRNDNSSRFGKFTELQFCPDGRLIGARSRTYLLEKSRVTTQSDGERNFHIFYQLLKQRQQFPELELASRDSFTFVRGSSQQDTEPPVNEEGDLNRTREALDLIGIEQDLQREIFQILAAILHLGETTFCVANGDVDASQIVDITPFSTACKLLGVDVSALERAVCNRNVFVGREVFLKPMTRDQATDCRDALAKSLYSKLFLWLVDRINETIGVQSPEALSFIGILDIFGFEHFEKNSFEQFCINYANEKLQQKFVQDVLKTVQLEYEEENISWSHIQFADNQDVLNLIEGRMGVISFLNEESLLATGTDAAFASKLGAVMENNPLLETPRLHQCAFSIYHYAGKVTYDATGFLDKHRDAILPDIKQVMSASKLAILFKTFADAATGPGTLTKRGSTRKKIQAQPKRTTVGTQFKESLSELMEKIGRTEVHYVRCLKPNGLKSAYCFSHHEIVNQLRCAGVIEAIRVSRSAYPSRIPHLECVKKFRVLLSSALPHELAPLTEHQEADTEFMKIQCEQLMDKLLPDRKIHDYQVGLTRVYFREGVLEMLETKRAWALRQYAIVLQKSVRCFIARRRFLKQKQRALSIQKYWRRYVLRQRFLKLKQGVVHCQARLRGIKARKQFRVMKFDHAIVRFQARCRAFVARRRYLKRRRAATKLQGFWRFTLVRLMFIRKMEKEKKYKALGSKVAQLQMKLDQKHTGSRSPAAPSAMKAKEENGSGSARNSFMAAHRFSSTTGIFDESQEVITALHEENEKLRKQLEQQEDEIQKLKTEIRNLRNWQKSKEVDEKVQKIAHRDQESKDLTYLSTLEHEYERLRSFICDSLDLPSETGSITTSPPAPLSSASSLRGSMLSPSESASHTNERASEAHSLLLKSAARLSHAKSKVSTKGSARRVKDHWEEIRNFPPPMHYSLGSVPWKRLLTDWAQGNPKKLDYMTRWLKNVLDGGPIVSDTFPMGVELKYVTPMMLDGFMQLIIPKLAERPDIQVHVHTKEFIGTSMRITLSQRESATSSNTNRSTSGPTRPRQPPPEVDEAHRISILANNHHSSVSSGRFSTASTASMSPSEPSLLSSSHIASSSTSSGLLSNVFRSHRNDPNHEHRSHRTSFFQSKK